MCDNICIGESGLYELFSLLKQIPTYNINK